MADRHQAPVALLTGAGSGIGRSVALRLADTAGLIVCADVRHDAVEKVAGEIEAAGGRAWAVAADVTAEGEVVQVVKATIERFGRLDVVVNAAGIAQTKPLLEITGQEWDRMFAVNVKGVFLVLREAARVMAGQRRGTIVNVASVSGRNGRPLQAHYAASKAAVINLTRSAALALAQYGVTVNAVCPGVVKTPMWEQIDKEMGTLFGLKPGEAFSQKVSTIPLGRAAMPETIADVVAFLASEQASYITGQAINVCGGIEMD
jgi:meso-butanediol dehydrogenase / (S,S)-butanediol dehydrogenase / diacetyl reductase